MFDLGPGGHFSRESPSGWSHVWHTLNSLVLPVPHLYSAAFASLSINSKKCIFLYFISNESLCSAQIYKKSQLIYGENCLVVVWFCRDCASNTKEYEFLVFGQEMHVFRKTALNWLRVVRHSNNIHSSNNKSRSNTINRFKFNSSHTSGLMLKYYNSTIRRTRCIFHLYDLITSNH